MYMGALCAHFGIHSHTDIWVYIMFNSPMWILTNISWHCIVYIKKQETLLRDKKLRNSP